MKLKKLLLGALPLALFAACSNDNDPANSGNQESESGNGKYLSVNINLPTVPSTRALNDSYDDGEVNEYTVFNGCLVIFKGADEATATFGAAYDLQTLKPEFDDDGENPDDNLTTSFLKSVRLSNLTYSANDNLYAFVMLNYKNVAEVTTGNGLRIINGIELQRAAAADGDTPAVAGTTFADAFNAVTQNPFYLGKGEGAYNFFMCNAPLSTKPGGKDGVPADLVPANIFTLALLDKSKVFDSQTQAEQNTAGSIYVERGVAKATLKWEKNTFADDSKVAANGGKKISFSFIGWALDVTESSSYIARNVKDAGWWAFTSDKLTPSNYRFVGSVKAGTTTIQEEKDLYRTYWCFDPNYNNDLTYTPVSTPTKTENFLSKENPLYCYENTFDLAYQNFKNTTRAVFQVTLKFDGVDEGSSFYVLNGNTGSIFTSLEDVESYPRNTIYGSLIIKEKLEEALNDGQKLTTEEIKKMVNIEFTRSEKTGIRSVTSVSFYDIINSTKTEDAELKKKFQKAPELSEADAANIMSDANSYVIEEYENGNSYYDLRFMHFAGTGVNDLAPWEKPTNEVLNTTQAYGSNAQNYLGRYGMVRNNWYAIEIGKVLNLGSPVIPDANVETSDDNNVIEKHLAFNINIFSWAKRVQNHDF